MAAQTGLKDSSRSQSCIAKRSPFPLLFRSAAKLTAGIHFRPNWNWIANRDEYWLRTDVKLVWHVLNRATATPLLTAGWSNPLQRCQDARDGPAILWIMVFRHVRPKYQFHLEHRRSSRLDTSGEPAIRSIIIIPWGEEECLARDFYSRYFLFFTARINSEIKMFSREREEMEKFVRKR